MAAREKRRHSQAAISRKYQIGELYGEAPPQNRHVRQQGFARSTLLRIADRQ
ncbi:hypothetical protein [Sinorhizobium meliloti]|uniref:hypothetical protein n=1 Tax=Rhizobium meliloti TaxID=382 RepID=UPI0013E28AC1|nr:hypothetical protein [Sinorhizobium meliloti]